MSSEFLKSQTSPKDAESENEKSGFMHGKVIRNCDNTGKGRVKVKLTARRGMEIWARVVVPDTGVYFIPQVGDEVLIGFHQGDGNEAFVMGRLWNDKSPPPRPGKDDPDRKDDTDGEYDPVAKRVIRTPLGHEIAFDDKEKSVVIKTKAGQRVKLKPDGIEIGADDKGKAVITLDTSGNISVKAETKISFSAPEIELQATTKLSLNGGANAELRAEMVQIN